MAIDDTVREAPQRKIPFDEVTLLLLANYLANKRAGHPYVGCPNCTAPVPEERAYDRRSAGVSDASGVPMVEWRHYCPVCEYDWPIPDKTS